MVQQHHFFFREFEQGILPAEGRVQLNHGFAGEFQSGRQCGIKHFTRSTEVIFSHPLIEGQLPGVNYRLVIEQLQQVFGLVTFGRSFMQGDDNSC